MAEIRASFYIECEELLEALQDGLQEIEDGASNSETINVVFRAVHSVKGGAGAFGLESLVRFAHSFETALEEVRSGRMQIDPGTLKLFFRSADHLADLVRISRDAGPFPDDVTATLLADLKALLGDSATEELEGEEEIEFQPMALSLDLDLDGLGIDDLPSFGDIDDLPHSAGRSFYIINFSPFPELFETGNEPYLLLRNMAVLGTASVSADISKIPDLHLLLPEIPHISWTVRLETDADAAEIASIFEFVDGLCSLNISLEGDMDVSQSPNHPDILPPLALLPMLKKSEAQTAVIRDVAPLDEGSVDMPAANLVVTDETPIPIPSGKTTSAAAPASLVSC
jgi:two-component system chemotaxis sensor kinase CheA